MVRWFSDFFWECHVFCQAYLGPKPGLIAAGLSAGRTVEDEGFQLVMGVTQKMDGVFIIKS